MPISVRPARSDDRQFIDRAGADSTITSISPIRPARAGDAAAAFRRAAQFCAERRDGLTLIAERDGERAGFVMLLFELTDDVTLQQQAFIVYMAVEPAHRRVGIARALLGAAEEEARARGASHLSLMVTEANEAARTLYERAGFLDERVQMTKKLDKAAR
jgi:ribosomal protein S18 acetylase RimI-like enzyme